MPPFFTGVKSSSAFCSSGEEDGGESKTIFFVSFFPAVPPVYYNASERKGREQSPLFLFPFSAFNGNNICDRTHSCNCVRIPLRYTVLCFLKKRPPKMVAFFLSLSSRPLPPLERPMPSLLLGGPAIAGGCRGFPSHFCGASQGLRGRRGLRHTMKGGKERMQQKKRRKNFFPDHNKFSPSYVCSAQQFWWPRVPGSVRAQHFYRLPCVLLAFFVLLA